MTNRILLAFLAFFILLTHLLYSQKNSKLKLFKNPMYPDEMLQGTLASSDSLATVWQTVSTISNQSPNIGDYNPEILNFLFQDTLLQIGQLKFYENYSILTQYPGVDSIFIKLNKIKNNIFESLDTLACNQIFELIKKLPASKEKIYWLNELFLKRGIMKENGGAEINNLEDMVDATIDLINNQQERVFASELAGDMFRNIGDYSISVIYYLKAREFLDMSDLIEKKGKDEWHGVLCNKIAYLYSHGKLNIDISKSALYHHYAANYYLTSSQSLLATREYLLLIKECLELYGDYGIEEPADTFNATHPKVIALNVLKFLNHSSQHELKSPENYFLLYWSAGNLCSKYGSNESAINYYIVALQKAIELKNALYIQQTLEELYVCCAITNNASQSLSIRWMMTNLNLYPDLKRTASVRFAHARAYLAHGKYDSALMVTDQILYSEYFSNENLFEIYDIKRDAIQLKWHIFSITNQDSAKLYLEALEIRLKNERGLFKNIMTAEFTGINSWLEKKVDNELILKQEARKKTLIIYGILVALLLSIAIIAYVISGKRRAEKKISLEKEGRLRSEKQNEINKINNRIKNNIHNQQSDKGILTNLIKNLKSSREDIIKYDELYNDYSSKASKNWLAESITLKDALETVEMYITAIKVRYPEINLVKEKINTPEIEKIRFIPAVLETLINNSVFRGLRRKAFRGEISFSINVDGENLICVVEDTGEPPSSNKAYFSREGSGLHLMKKQIENMYFECSREAPPEFCTAKIRDNRKGTVVKLTLPYEKV